MSTKASPTVKQENGFNFSSIFPYIAIPIALLTGWALFTFVLGDTANFEGGAFSAKSIQGKILSMQLTEHVKPAPKVETVKSYNDEEEGQFVSLVNDGAFIEDIAEAMGRSVNSIRGKALSLLRAGEINAIPKQKETKGSSKADPLAGVDIDGMTVEEIADEIGKTVRGVKTMLTRRGLQCSDYNGAAKKDIG